MRDIKTNNYESPLPRKDILQGVSSDLPIVDDIVSFSKIDEKNQFDVFCSHWFCIVYGILQKSKSTACSSGMPFVSTDSHATMNGFTSSQQSFDSSISFNERCKPYKPKFHKVCSISPATTEENSENMLLTDRSPIDYSKKLCGSLEQQAQMEPKEMEPLNLSKATRKKLPTVEPLYGINATCNLQSTYLDEPITSPGPFLGKTRLVDDYNDRRRVSVNQPIQTVKNVNDLNHIGIRGLNDPSVSHGEEMNWRKQTNDINIISSTSEFIDHIKVADSAKLVASPVDSVCMQIAEVSSSVNSSMIATTAPHSKRSLQPERAVKTAVNIASEYIELANKQIHSTTNDEHAMQSSIGPVGPVRPIPANKDATKSKSSQPIISFIQNGDGPLRCTLCSASFPKNSLLKMHMNIHYMQNPERKFHCGSCDKSFRTQNRLQKHTCFEKKIVSKPNNKNPRPFKCSDCNIAFRGHGFLAKHLRSKTHIQNLENLQKIPSGTYVMIEKAQINLTDIDTTDCDSSLASLKILAKKLNVDQN